MIIVSLGMTGKFTYTHDKYCHVSFQLNNQMLYYHDVRRFGKVDVVSMNNLPKYYKSLGVNLINHLDRWITEKEWIKIFEGKLKNRNICNILLDQNILSGIGFYIMTDVLYLACVHPLRLGKTITKDELEMIRIATHEIINLSYQSQGYSFSDYEQPDGTKGTYVPLIYGQKKDHNGFKVLRQKINKTRSIHYVEEVQI